MSGDKGELAERLSAMKLLKMTAAPKDYRTVPPNLNPVTETEQEITILGNFKNAPAAMAPLIYIDRGMVVWHLHSGAGRVRRFYEMKRNAVPPITGAIPGTMTLGDDLWVVAEPSSDVQVSPDLSLNFTFCRLFGGYISISSATTSTTATTLTGLAHAGAWVDTRDGWQSAAQIGNAVTPTLLSTFSVCKKDGITEENLEDGVMAVAGGDIPIHHTVVDTRKEDVHDGGIFLVDDQQDMLQPSFPSGGGAWAVIASQWVSPWNIDFTVTSNPGLSVFPHKSLGAIDTYGYYEFVINPSVADFTFTLVPPTPVPFIFFLEIEVDDKYCAVSDTAYIDHSTSTKYVIPVQFNGPSFPLVPVSLGKIYHRALASRAGYYSYLGSVLRYTLINASGPLPLTLVPTDHMLFRFRVEVVTQGVFQPGAVGPVRLLQWTDVADGQNIQVRGLMRYGCVTGGNLAPYVQASTFNDPGVGDLSWLPLLQAIYNSDNPEFKRCYTMKEHEVLRNVILPGLTLMSLKDSTRFPPVVKQIAQAAGFFDDLVGGLIQTAKYAIPTLSAVGGSIMGGPVGGLVGGLIGTGATSQITGKAAGQYPGQSAGMFGEQQGSSAGMYGEQGNASGMYGQSGGFFEDALQSPLVQSAEALAEQYIREKRIGQAAGMYDTRSSLRRRTRY